MVLRRIFGPKKDKTAQCNCTLLQVKEEETDRALT
jgi:hypothetical protein